MIVVPDPRLVSLTNEVVSEVLDSRVGVPSDRGLGVMADDDGLLSLGNGDSIAALFKNARQCLAHSGP